MKTFSNITKKQVAEKGVQALANRPNAASQYGVSGLSPEALKLWFDQLSQFLANKINDIHDVLSSPEACDYIRMPQEDNKMSLKDFVEGVATGMLVRDMLKAFPSADSGELQPLQNIINSLAKGLSDNSEAVAACVKLVKEASPHARAYTVSASGQQEITPISDEPLPSALPLYDNSGHLLSATPTDEAHVVTKKYADAAFGKLAAKAAVRINEDTDQLIVELVNGSGEVIDSDALEIKEYVLELAFGREFSGAFINFAECAGESETAGGYIKGGEIDRKIQELEGRLSKLE